jgi:hypothetical protein
MGRAIEEIAAKAKCDVLIGIQGRQGKMLTQKTPASAPKTPAEEEVTY